MSDLLVPRVDVAMATYNGGLYLREMLDSIVGQTHSNVRVLLSDDGSSDDTCDIAQEYRGLMNLELLEGASRKGVLRNFETAISATDASYVALCDQDDFWMKDKLSLLLRRLQELEVEYGPSTPLLVFSDVEVVDEKLRTLKKSMFDKSIKDKAASIFEDFFFSSHVPGCAVMFNRKLLDLALPFPDVRIHDLWLIQLASIFGHVSYVDQPLVKYRQHENNVIGLGVSRASGLSKLAYPIAFIRQRATKWEEKALFIRKTLLALEKNFSEDLPDNVRALIEYGALQPTFLRLIRLLGSAKTGERSFDCYGILANLVLRNR